MLVNGTGLRDGQHVTMEPDALGPPLRWYFARFSEVPGRPILPSSQAFRDGCGAQGSAEADTQSQSYHRRAPHEDSLLPYTDCRPRFGILRLSAGQLLGPRVADHPVPSQCDPLLAQPLLPAPLGADPQMSRRIAPWILPVGSGVRTSHEVGGRSSGKPPFLCRMGGFPDAR